MAVFTGEGVDHLTMRVASGSETDMPFANLFRVDNNIVTLEFRGDHGTFRKYVPNGVSGTMAFDKLSTDMFAMMGVDEVTASLPAGFASRFYPELGTYPFVEVNAYLFETDDDTGEDVTHALRIFKAKLQQFVPPEAGNIAVMTNNYQWSGNATLEDIDGGALTGVSTKKVIYALDLAA